MRSEFVYRQLHPEKYSGARITVVFENKGGRVGSYSTWLQLPALFTLPYIENVDCFQYFFDYYKNKVKYFQPKQTRK